MVRDPIPFGNSKETLEQRAKEFAESFQEISLYSGEDNGCLVCQTFKRENKKGKTNFERDELFYPIENNILITDERNCPVLTNNVFTLRWLPVPNTNLYEIYLSTPRIDTMLRQEKEIKVSDYLAFKLPVSLARDFMYEVLKNPEMYRMFLQNIYAKNPIEEGRQIELVVSGIKGLDSMTIETERMEEDILKSRNQLVGPFLISSDGETMQFKVRHKGRDEILEIPVSGFSEEIFTAKTEA